MFSIGRGLGKQGGKDKCLLKMTFFIKLAFRKKQTRCRRAEIKWREEV